MTTTYKILPVDPVIIDGQEVPGTPRSVLRSDGVAIPYAPDNGDYVSFKKQIFANQAELYDQNGQLMTQEQAKAYVATLP